IIRESGESSATMSGIESLETLDGWAVLRAAREGNKLCTLIVDEMTRHLAVGLGNLVNLVDPEAIVLDQRLEMCGPKFLENLRRAIRLQALSHLTENLVVRYGTLGGEAGVLGAGLLVLEELFGIPDLKPPRFLIEPDIVEGRAAGH